MANLRSLVIGLYVRTTDFDKGLKGAQSKMTAFGRGFGGGIGSMFKMAGAALPYYAIGKASLEMMSFVKNAISSNEEVKKLGETLGKIGEKFKGLISWIPGKIAGALNRTIEDFSKAVESGPGRMGAGKYQEYFEDKYLGGSKQRRMADEMVRLEQKKFETQKSIAFWLRQSREAGDLEWRIAEDARISMLKEELEVAKRIHEEESKGKKSVFGIVGGFMEKGMGGLRNAWDVITRGQQIVPYDEEKNKPPGKKEENKVMWKGVENVWRDAVTKSLGGDKQAKIVSATERTAKATELMARSQGGGMVFGS